MRNLAILYTCANIISGLSLVPGAAPTHITALDSVSCAAVAPGTVTWTQSGAVTVTITRDSTGFLLSVPSGSTVGNTASVIFTGS